MGSNPTPDRLFYLTDVVFYVYVDMLHFASTSDGSLLTMDPLTGIVIMCVILCVHMHACVHVYVCVRASVCMSPLFFA